MTIKVNDLIEKLNEVGKPNQPLGFVINEEVFDIDEIEIATIELEDAEFSCLDMVFIEIKGEIFDEL
jgi:hypothetical protein